MFSPFGKIISEDFLWHTRGPKRGEPRGYAFIQFSSKEVSNTLLLVSSLCSNFLIPTFKVSMQEAIQAKEKMHGRMACGRPLVVRLASEKCPLEGFATFSRSVVGGSRSSLSGCGQISRSAKIAAIKNKLKAMDEESHNNPKKQKNIDTSCSDSHENPSPER